MTEQKIIDEKRIKVLRDRFTWLKIRLEATANQLDALGGELSIGDGKFLKTLEKHAYKLNKKHLAEHEWINKTIDLMDELQRPFTIKEIAEILFSHQDLLVQATVYNNTRKAITALLRNGMAVKSATHINGYVLSKFN